MSTGTSRVPGRHRTNYRRVHEMTIVRRPSPFGELMSLRSAMDRLFEDSFVRRPLGSPFDSAATTLPLDVTRTADALVVEAALPGIKPEDVEITVEDGTLSIHGEYRDERREGEGESLVQEIRRGSVSRSVGLPTGLEPDKATATFEHGVLTLRIPKAESVKPRQIRISPTVDGQATPTDTRPVETAANGSTNEPATAGSGA
jgi:HSP20 family protein